MFLGWKNVIKMGGVDCAVEFDLCMIHNSTRTPSFKFFQANLPSGSTGVALSGLDSHTQVDTLKDRIITNLKDQQETQGVERPNIIAYK